MVTKTMLELDSTTKTLALLDPRVALDRGYAIIKQEKAVIMGIKHLNKSKPVTIVMSDGEVSVKAD
jgi:exonuclease VII large subunit